MKYNPDKHHRRSIRLKGYDYSQPGAYFVTVIAQNRERLFGEIKEGRMLHNPAGVMIRDVWERLPTGRSQGSPPQWIGLSQNCLLSRQ